MLFLVFCFIAFEQSELFGQNHPPYVDLNKLHMPTKFHDDRTSLRRSEVKRIAIFRQFEFMNFTENP